MSLIVTILGKDKLSVKLKAVGTSIFRLGKSFVKFGVLGATAISGISVKLAGDFAKGLTEISTLISDVTEKDIKVMSKELRGLAASTGVGLTPLLKAKYDIISAGFNNAAKSARVLEESAKLAVAGVTSVAEAADILTTALNAYGLSAENAIDVSDILFTTVRLGKTTITELSGALGKVLPLANAAGISLSDVGAAMASITTAGLGTREAATALRGAIQALAAPTDLTRKAMFDAGIEIQKFEDGSFNLVETIRQFEGISPDVMRKFVPEVEAATAVLAMANNIDVLSNNIGQMNLRAGAADEAYSKMETSWNQKISRMVQGFRGALIELGDAIIKELTPFVDIVNDELEELGDIGWDAIGIFIVTNWRVILKKVIDQTALGAKIIGLKFVEGFKSVVGTNLFADLFLTETGKITLRAKQVAGELGIPFLIAFDLVKKEGVAWADNLLGSMDVIDSRADLLIEEFINNFKEGFDFIERGATEVAARISAIEIDPEKFRIDADFSLDPSAVVFPTTITLSKPITIAGKFKLDVSDFGAMLAETLLLPFDAVRAEMDRLVAKWQLTNEQIASLQEDFNARIFEMDNLSFEGRLMHIENMREKWIAATGEITLANQLATELIAEQWLENQRETNAVWVGLESAWGALTDSLVNIHMTGKQRRLKIEKAFKESVVKFIGEQLKEQLEAWLAEEAAKGLLEVAKVGAEAAGQAASLGLEKASSEASIGIAVKEGIAITAAMTPAAVVRTAATGGGNAAKGLIAFLAMAAGIVAFVSSRKQTGGVVGGAIGGGVKDSVPVLLSPREIVSTPEAANQFGDEILKLNQIADSGGLGKMGRSGGDTFQIFALDSQSFEEFLSRNPIEFAEGVRNLVVDGHLKLEDLGIS